MTRYVNLRFTYLLTYLSTPLICPLRFGYDPTLSDGDDVCVSVCVSVFVHYRLHVIRKASRPARADVSLTEERRTRDTAIL